MAGWRQSLLGWRPSLLGWRPSLLIRLEAITVRLEAMAGWRQSLLGWRPSLLGWRPSLLIRLKAIALRLEAMAIRLEAIATGFAGIAGAGSQAPQHCREVIVFLCGSPYSLQLVVTFKIDVVRRLNKFKAGSVKNTIYEIMIELGLFVLCRIFVSSCLGTIASIT